MPTIPLDVRTKKDDPCLYAEGRPRLDLDYCVYWAHDFLSVVVLSTSFLFGGGQDLKPHKPTQILLLPHVSVKSVT